MTGFIESTRELTYGPRRGALVFAFVRSDDGRAWFVHPSDCDGAAPRRFDRVTFEPDEHGDPRGARARKVRILEAHAEPAGAGELEDVEITCSECRRPFVWLAGEQAFYRERRLCPPKKCRNCRPVVRARLGLPRRLGATDRM